MGYCTERRGLIAISCLSIDVAGTALQISVLTQLSRSAIPPVSFPSPTFIATGLMRCDYQRKLTPIKRPIEPV